MLVDLSAEMQDEKKRAARGNGRGWGRLWGMQKQKKCTFATVEMKKKKRGASLSSFPHEPPARVFSPSRVDI